MEYALFSKRKVKQFSNVAGLIFTFSGFSPFIFRQYIYYIRLQHTTDKKILRKDLKYLSRMPKIDSLAENYLVCQKIYFILRFLEEEL